MVSRLAIGLGTGLVHELVFCSIFDDRLWLGVGITLGFATGLAFVLFDPRPVKPSGHRGGWSGSVAMLQRTIKGWILKVRG